VRELEILHDQLLQLLANRNAANLLNPRDIIVMRVGRDSCNFRQKMP
jgi:exonuclease V gamma subunit